MPRLLALLLLGLAACTDGSRPSSAPSPSPEGSESRCPDARFRATVLVGGISREPERGPVDDLGSFSDLVWTIPSGGQTGRSIGIELSRGEDKLGPPYVPADPRAVAVRGFPGEVGDVEDGVGLRWREGDAACDLYRLNAYGPFSEADVLRFVEGLRETG